MKKLLPALALGIALAFTGCMTTNPETGEKEFDEYKTALLLSPLKSGIAIGTMVGAEADVNTGTGLRIAEQVIGNILAEDGAISRDTIKARMAEISIDGLSPEDNAKYVSIVGDMVLDEYDNLIRFVVRDGLSPENPADWQLVTRMVLETLQKGINYGLALASLPE